MNHWFIRLLLENYGDLNRIGTSNLTTPVNHQRFYKANCSSLFHISFTVQQFFDVNEKKFCPVYRTQLSQLVLLLNSLLIFMFLPYFSKNTQTNHLRPCSIWTGNKRKFMDFDADMFITSRPTENRHLWIVF